MIYTNALYAGFLGFSQTTAATVRIINDRVYSMYFMQIVVSTVDLIGSYLISICMRVCVLQSLAFLINKQPSPSALAPYARARSMQNYSTIFGPVISVRFMHYFELSNP